MKARVNTMDAEQLTKRGTKFFATTKPNIFMTPRICWAWRWPL